MATRALIGRLTGWDGDRPMGKGVYHACDGRPTRLGARLFWLFRDTRPEDMDESLRELAGKHPGGWLQLGDWDRFCHPHGERAGVGASDLQRVVGEDCEWACFISLEGGDPIMVVAHRMARWSLASLEPLEEWWVAGAIVLLNGDEPDWRSIELSSYNRYAGARYAARKHALLVRISSRHSNLGGAKMIDLRKREEQVAILLDLDGTLIQRYGEEEDFTPRPLADQGQIWKLGTPLAICSNQGGIAWGLAGGRPGKRYPDWNAMLERVRFGMELARVKLAFLALYHPLAPIPEDTKGLLEAAARIGMPEEVALAVRDPRQIVLLDIPLNIPGVEEGTVLVSWDPEWRKPAPGMLKDARVHLECTRFIAKGCRWIYIGDEDDDEKAARAAGMDFLSAKKIRLGGKPGGRAQTLGKQRKSKARR